MRTTYMTYVPVKQQERKGSKRPLQDISLNPFFQTVKKLKDEEYEEERKCTEQERPIKHTIDMRTDGNYRGYEEIHLKNGEVYKLRTDEVNEIIEKLENTRWKIFWEGGECIVYSVYSV